MDTHGGSDQTLKQSAHFIIWMGICFFSHFVVSRMRFCQIFWRKEKRCICKMRLMIIYPFSLEQKIEKKTRASLIKYYIKVNVRGFFSLDFSSTSRYQWIFITPVHDNSQTTPHSTIYLRLIYCFVVKWITAKAAHKAEAFPGSCVDFNVYFGNANLCDCPLWTISRCDAGGRRFFLWHI